MKQFDCVNNIQIYLRLLFFLALASGCGNGRGGSGNQDGKGGNKTWEQEQAEADTKFTNTVKPKYLTLRGKLVGPLHEGKSLVDFLLTKKWYEKNESIEIFKKELEEAAKLAEEIQNTSTIRCSNKLIEVKAKVAGMLHTINSLKKEIGEQKPANSITSERQDSIKTYIDLLLKNIKVIDEKLK